jgi:hypothetical protein
MHIAKVYFLKSHDDGQRLHEPLVCEQSHNGVRGYENCLLGAKRGRVGRRARARARAHTETTLSAGDRPCAHHHVQNLRIEQAKPLLESSDQPVDRICYANGTRTSRSFGGFSNAGWVWRKRGTVACSNSST